MYVAPHTYENKATFLAEMKLISTQEILMYLYVLRINENEKSYQKLNFGRKM